MATKSSVAVATVVDTAVDAKPPGLWDVVFFNDNKTTVEFVIILLMNIFRYDYETSMSLTKKINDTGRSVVATFSHEIAGTKRDECVSAARTNGFPLKVEIEPSSVPAA
jgi:ATP-dependent Clp protease adaptor protein ClpS